MPKKNKTASPKSSKASAKKSKPSLKKKAKITAKAVSKKKAAKPKAVKPKAMRKAKVPKVRKVKAQAKVKALMKKDTTAHSKNGKVVAKSPAVSHPEEKPKAGKATKKEKAIVPAATAISVIDQPDVQEKLREIGRAHV